MGKVGLNILIMVKYVSGLNFFIIKSLILLGLG